MRRLIERVFERLLLESSQGNSYGTCVYVKYEDVTRTAIAYDADKLVSLLAGESEITSSHLESCIIDCTLGTIMIRETPKIKGPCAGAWEVIGSAGPGYGKLVYAMGYYMSPTGRLIPDRSTLSKDAVLAWAKVGKDGSIPLDDKTHPDTGREPFHDLYHTEDPSDDCLIYNTGKSGEPSSTVVRGVNRLDPVYVDAVNRAYAMGTMGYDIDGMRAAHERFVSKVLTSKLGIPPGKDVNDIFDPAGALFFDKHYTTKPLYLFTMKIKLSQLRKIIREELLRENKQGSANNLAAHIVWEGDVVSVVFYDPTIFYDSIESNKNVKKAANESVRGYLKLNVKTEFGPCDGAAEIKGTWGPGYGNVIYNTAFELSPSGKVMPDRTHVSAAAKKRWKREEENMPSRALDDREHKTCGNNNTHTADKSDDCQVHSEPENPNDPEIPFIRAINKSYDGKGRSNNLEGMKQRHKTLIDDVDNLDLLGVSQQTIENQLMASVKTRFDETLLAFS